MALQVWLTLNGSLKNQGCKGDISITNNGATVSSGKVTSNCYSFNGSNQYLQLSKTLGSFYNSDFSLTVWLKPLVAKRGIILSEYLASGSGNVSFELTSDLRLRVWWNSNPDIYTTEKLTVNVWSHIAITKTSNQILFYINGNLVYTHNQSGGFSERISTALARIGDDYRSGTDVDYNGMINDFRLYNHCLSVKEVKDLAKGLMLHYTLSRSGTNYLIGSSNYLNATQSKPQTDGYLSYPIYANNLVAGDYIYSIEVTKGTLCSQHGGVTDYTKGYWTLWAYTDSSTYSNSNYSHYAVATCYTSSNLLGKIGNTYYWKITINNSYPNLAVRINTYSDGTHNAIINFGKLKLEKYSIGINKPTPWIPNSADALYSQMGLNDNIEYDATGYSNVGYKVNISAWNTDTPRYLSSMIFNGSNGYIYIRKNSARPTDAITISLWCYKLGTSNCPPISCTEGGGWNICSDNGYLMANMWTSGKGGYIIASTGKTWSELINAWHYIAVTYDGSSVKIYLDGVLKESVSTSGTIVYPNNYTFIGAEAGGNTSTPSGNYFDGRISDVRIYSTALSSADVLELYNVSASLDKNKNMYCYELVES